MAVGNLMRANLAREKLRHPAHRVLYPDRCILTFMPIAYLLCGSTGAGKTTHGKSLALSQQAQLFSIDEWMQNLFWQDAPPNSDIAWASERVRRCERQIWLIAERLLQAKISIVLDLGFSKREQREHFRKLVTSAGATPKLLYLDIPASVRWERVKARNLSKEGTYQFDVSEETFRWMESYFEAPGDDELL
ncbi:MAG: ATP-binding protein [Proteobacteria bacterium]|nr:MAG: ATP-binding protein [Pseudomonadota bacterium]